MTTEKRTNTVETADDDADGHTWLIEGTPEEIREALAKAGYAVAK